MVMQDRKVVERKARLEIGVPTDGLTFGQRLRRLRISKRWSQARLARQIRPQMSANFISDIERGKTSPKLESVRSLAVALGVDEIYLVHGYEPTGEQYVDPTVAQHIEPAPHSRLFTDVAPQVEPKPEPKAVEELEDNIFEQDIPENGDPTFQVKVQKQGKGVLLSFFFND